MAAILEGLTAIEIGSDIAAPLCTKLMADHGAEVVKVEPLEGDPARAAGPFPGDAPHPERSGRFLYYNTGKKSLALDLASQAGRDLIRRLARQADIVVEDRGPGGMESLGLGYEALAALNPGLVMVSISPFGQTGPYRDWQATDIVIQAMGGMMYVIGEPDLEPIKAGGDQAQYMGGMNAFSAALAALLYRDATGEGQHVDISLQEGIVPVLEYNLPAYSYLGAVLKRWHNRHMFSFPAEVYPCADGWACVGASRAWEDLSTVLETPALNEERFRLNHSRVHHDVEFVGLLTKALAGWKKRDLFHTGQAYRFSWTYVPTVAELLEDPQYVHDQFFVEVDHPEAGRAKYPGYPYRLSESEPELRPAPRLGQHTREVLGGRLGLGAEELARLRQQGVIP